MELHEILKNHNLSITDCRRDILKSIIDSETAIAFRDIEASIENPYDRVTIYRTIKTFLGKGIIHKVLDDSGDIKYAICSSSCAEDEHNHEHIHFKCIECGQTICMEDFKIPEFKLPKGYKVLSADLLLQGVCKKCNSIK